MSVEVLLEFPGLTWLPIVKKDEKRSSFMVGVAGFEPATPASRTRLSCHIVLKSLAFWSHPTAGICVRS
jgi:hypothetical protein